MKRNFCPKCGKVVDKLYDNLCSACFLEKFSVKEKLPDKIIVGVCKKCGRIYTDKIFAETVESAVDLILTRLLKQKEVKSATYKVVGDKVHVKLNLVVENLEKIEEKVLNLITKSITCKHCSLKEGRYFQTVLQIRSGQINTEQILAEVEARLGVINKYDRLAFISSIEKLPEGVDVYIGSKSAANNVVRYLKSKYNIKTKISRKLFGIKNGKRVYRDTILVSIGD
jgi:nonsense-mediated mRNA decay protein 3